MIAAIYARKSTEQAGVSDEQKSVARQIEHARAYATRNGWIVADEHIYVDDGIGGAEFANRPGFLRLMNVLKPRAPFQFIIMSEEARLGRESIETAYALKQLVTAGVRLFFYLEDRERTLDSPTDKIMLSLTTFADELERVRARQRTYDAMARKARGGQVTGGRVFGYDNLEIVGPDGKRSHVERRVNDAEADVVRRVFRLCADGVGTIRIAKCLNSDGAVSPRSQQGRPSGWAASSVRAILYRPLYRGEIVWNRSQKRNAWGQKSAHARPETEWIRVSAPDARIVADDLWAEAHARLTASREAYLRHADGRMWGRPVSGTEAKYLLTGLTRCGLCGGTFEVRSRQHGRRREYFYACSSYWRRGSSICPSKVEIPMESLDAAVLEAIEDDVLDADLIREVVDGSLTELSASPSTITGWRETLDQQLASVDQEMHRLAAAIAAGGGLDALVAALKERETLRTDLQRQLAGVSSQAAIVAGGADALHAKIEERLRDWRRLLRRHVPQARQIISKLLNGRLAVTPETRDGVKGFRLTGCGSFMKFLNEFVDFHKRWRPQREQSGCESLERPIDRWFRAA